AGGSGVCRVEHDPARVLRGIAVRAPEPAGDHAALALVRNLRHVRCQLVDVGRCTHLGRGRHGPPPSRDKTALAVLTLRLHPVWTPRPNTMSHRRPINWSGRSDNTISSGASPFPWSTSSAYRSRPRTKGRIDSWYHGMLAFVSCAFSNAHKQYPTSTVPDETARRYA